MKQKQENLLLIQVSETLADMVEKNHKKTANKIKKALKEFTKTLLTMKCQKNKISPEEIQRQKRNQYAREYYHRRKNLKQKPENFSPAHN